MQIPMRRRSLRTQSALRQRRSNHGVVTVSPSSVFVVADTSTTPRTGGGAFNFFAQLWSGDGTAVDVTKEAAFAVSDNRVGDFDGSRFVANVDVPADTIGIASTITATFGSAAAHATVTLVIANFGGPTRDALRTDALLIVDSCGVRPRWPAGDLLEFLAEDAADAHVVLDAGDASFIAGLDATPCATSTAGHACVRVVPAEAALLARITETTTFYRAYVDGRASRRAVTFVVLPRTLRPC